MKWLKAALVGALAALVMTGIRLPLVYADLMPYNLSPPMAFLAWLGLPADIVPAAGLAMHLGYGVVWSLIFAAIFMPRCEVGRLSVGHGIALGILLWLIFMLIYSPIMGWGFFGFGGEGRELPPEDPLHLGSLWGYLGACLGFHIIYGAILGWLNPLWIGWGRRKPAAGPRKSPFRKD